MRILIAEDDVTSRSMLAAMLKKAGYEVVETVNGAAAWDELQKPDAPNLSILDWMMPEMDGLEVIRRVRGLPTGQSSYIILLTARGEKKDIIAGLEQGADDYLAKPFDVGELQARLSVGRRTLELQKRLAEQIEALRLAMDHIKTLRGIIPICSFCHKIRNDEGCWDRFEKYIGAHSPAEFSHGICPECMKTHYPEVDGEDSDDV